MQLRRFAFLFFVVAVLQIAALSNRLLPDRHRPITLPLRLHHSPKDTVVRPQRLHQFGKRAAVDDLFCSIGVTSSCPDGQAATPMQPDTDSDVSNCGRLGNVCPSPSAGFGSAACQAGICVTSCPSGYTYTLSGCVDTSSDTSNCGYVAKICPTTYAYGSGVRCEAGVCRAEKCDDGYSYAPESRSCIPTASRTSCFGLGCIMSTSTPTLTSSATPTSSAVFMTASSPSSSLSSPSSLSPSMTTAAVLSNSTVVSSTSTSSSSTTPSSSASSLSSLAASSSSTSTTTTTSSSTTTHPAPFAFASASSRARAKRARLASTPHPPSSLCPAGLTACPITRSFYSNSSPGGRPYALHHAAAAAKLPSSSRERADYECIATDFEASNCGGCTSRGEGANCGLIPRAKSYGCGEGRCIVFQCEGGFRVNEKATGCERVKGAPDKWYYKTKGGKKHHSSSSPKHHSHP